MTLAGVFLSGLFDNNAWTKKHLLPKTEARVKQTTQEDTFFALMHTTLLFNWHLFLIFYLVVFIIVFVVCLLLLLLSLSLLLLLLLTPIIIFKICGY